LISSGAQAPTEEVVAAGLEAAKPFIKVLVEAQNKLASQAAKETADYPVFLPYSDEVYDAVAAQCQDDLAKVYQIADKQERQDADDELKAKVKEALEGKLDEEQMLQFSAAYKAVSKKVMRTRVLKEGIRIDGRGLSDIRVIDAEVAVIPRTHGSAIFQRGETQILGVTTLNMLK
ncbi:MAG: polyribonucleotide nucleotidyltransferase, partial [Aquiluna sp.]